MSTPVELVYQIQDRASAALEEMARKAGQVSEADKRLVGAVKAVEAATEAKARALGITTAELKAMERAIQEQARAEAAATKETERATAAAKKLADEKRRLKREMPTKELQELGDRAGRTESVMLGLSGALDLVAPGMGDLTRGAGDLAGGFEAATKGGVSLAPVIGGVALVAAGLYLAWKNVNEGQELAEASAKDVKAANAALKPVLEATRDTLIDLREASGEITKEEAARLRTSLSGFRAFQEAVSGTVERVKELRKQQGGASAALGDWAEEGQQGPIWLGLFKGAIDGVTTSGSEVEEQIGALMRTVESAADATKEYVGAQQELGDTEGINAGIEATNALLREQVALLQAALSAGAGARRSASEIGRRSPAALRYAEGQTGSTLAGLTEQLAAAVGSGDTTAIQDVAQVLNTLAAVAAEQEKFLESVKKYPEFAEAQLKKWQVAEAQILAGFEEINQGLQDALSALEYSIQEAARQLVTGAVQFAAGLVSGDLGGALSGALSGAGSKLTEAAYSRAVQGKTGVGAMAGAGAALGAAAGGIGVLLGLGAMNDSDPRTSVADALEKQLKAQKDNLIEGIEALPEILLDVIPALVAALVTELPPAIARAIFDIFSRLFEWLSGDRKDSPEEEFSRRAGGRIGSMGAGERTASNPSLSRLQGLYGPGRPVYANPMQALSVALGGSTEELTRQRGLQVGGSSLAEAVGGGRTVVIRDSVIGDKAQLARLLREAESAYGSDRRSR